MSEPTLEDLHTRLDDLLKEVRRQGRAAIAAQAAAESCLEALRTEPKEAEGATGDGEAERWLRAIIPVADALDRVRARAEHLAAPRAMGKPTLLQRLAGAPEAEGDAAARAALAEGLRVLQAQLEGSLADLGVTVDRRTGEALDEERQRVVEVRPPRAGEAPGTVVEVARAGYALSGVVVREADVVVTGEGKSR
jgi:molecular chaperone GrpE (heat shock protein)